MKQIFLDLHKTTDFWVEVAWGGGGVSLLILSATPWAPEKEKREWLPSTWTCFLSISKKFLDIFFASLSLFHPFVSSLFSPGLRQKWNLFMKMKTWWDTIQQQEKMDLGTDIVIQSMELSSVPARGRQFQDRAPPTPNRNVCFGKEEKKVIFIFLIK